MSVLIDLELNPRVRDIIKAAVKAAQPIWLGIVDSDKVEICARQQMLLYADGYEYLNAERLVFGPLENYCNADGVCLAKTKISAPIDHWRCNTIGGQPPPVWLYKGDSLLFTVGSIRMTGDILDRFAE